MRRNRSVTASDRLHLSLTVQARRLLEELAGVGLYGKTPTEVAQRFVEAGMQHLLEVGVVRLSEPLALEPVVGEDEGETK